MSFLDVTEQEVYITTRSLELSCPVSLELSCPVQSLICVVGPQIVLLSSYKTTYKNLITKREVLQDISKIFNPLGFFLRAKILIQTFWKPKIAWDEPLDAELHTEWKAASFHSDEVLFSPNHPFTALPITVSKHMAL